MYRFWLKFGTTAARLWGGRYKPGGGAEEAEGAEGETSAESVERAHLQLVFSNDEIEIKLGYLCKVWTLGKLGLCISKYTHIQITDIKNKWIAYTTVYLLYAYLIKNIHIFTYLLLYHFFMFFETSHFLSLHSCELHWCWCRSIMVSNCGHR